MQGPHDEHDAPDLGHARSDHASANGHATEDENPNGLSDTAMATVATVGAVGVAAVVFEAALIPGIALGVAAALAPSYVPRLGAALNPILRSGVRGAYKLGHKTREIVSEAREHLNDIAAEVEAEQDAVGEPTAKAGETPHV